MGAVVADSVAGAGFADAGATDLTSTTDLAGAAGLAGTTDLANADGLAGAIGLTDAIGLAGAAGLEGWGMCNLSS